MINSELPDRISKAILDGIVLDYWTLLAFFLVVWVIFGRSKEFLLAIIILFLAQYGINELFLDQSIAQMVVDDCVREISVTNRTSSPFALGFQTKTKGHTPFVFSGIVQTINMIKGDRKYTLSKTLASAIAINCTERIIYRSNLSKPLPEKVIFVCQHIKYMFDFFPFLAYIPDSHKLTTFNDFTTGLRYKALGKICFSLFAKHLYGAYAIDRSERDTLKDQVTGFVNSMDQEKDPHVFAIWPSGKAWLPDQPNGVDQFRLGAFYMSVYTGIPVCIIHGRIAEDEKSFIVEQSDIIEPPAVLNREPSYIEFYENSGHRSVVDGFRMEVENLYRDMDSRLCMEVNTH